MGGAEEFGDPPQRRLEPRRIPATPPAELELVTAMAARVPPSAGSAVVKELNAAREDDGLGHAKRVRKCHSDNGLLTVLLGRAEYTEHLPTRVQDIVAKRCLQPFRVHVPKRPASDKATAEQWSTYWPLRITVRPGPSQADLGTPLSAEEADNLNALGARTVRLANCASAGNAALVWDPKNGEIVREAIDASSEHSLRHAAMRAVEDMAQRDLCMWPPLDGVIVGEKRGRDGMKKPPEEALAPGGYSLVRPPYIGSCSLKSGPTSVLFVVSEDAPCVFPDVSVVCAYIVCRLRSNIFALGMIVYWRESHV